MFRPPARARFLALLLASASAAACADRNPAAVSPPADPPPALAALQCAVDVRALTLGCRPASPSGSGGVSAMIIGGQGTNVRLASSGTSYDAATGILRSDVTLENLMQQALGTTDGAFAAPEGVRVFFSSGPTVSEGSGIVTVANADGEGVFTGTGQKYFQYAGMLAPGRVSAPREWRFAVPATATHFVFTVFVAAPVRGPEVPPAAIVFLAGAGVTDTVDATALLRVGVRGPDGAPAANTEVRFDGVSLPYPLGYEVWSYPVTGAVPPSGSTTVLTDSLGIARVRVRLGVQALAGHLLVNVPDLELEDTARYTILPGRVKQVRTFPADTPVSFGGRAALRFVTYDRRGNPRPPGDPVTLAVVEGPGTAQGSEIVGGSSLGRVTTVATVAGIQGFSFVRVVPPGRLVVSATASNTGESSAIYTLSLDNSGLRRVRSTAAGAGYFSAMPAAWLAPGKLVYQDTRNGGFTELYTLDVATGASAFFRPAADRAATETSPRVSRDGAWVYFGAGTLWNHYLYRARADGTGTERVSVYDSGPNEGGADPSPDGTRIVYVNTGPGSLGDERLYVMDLAAREPASLGLAGVHPRWSPDGTRIAYAGPLSDGGNRHPMVVNADGTNAHEVSATLISGEIDWSPDGRYLVAASNFHHQLLIVDMVAGTELLVPYTGMDGFLFSPLWEP